MTFCVSANLSEYALSDVETVAGTDLLEPFAPLKINSPYLHPRQILSSFPSVTATPEVVAAIRNGRSVNLPEFSSAPLVKVFADQQLLIAVMHRIAGTLFQPRAVLFSGNESLPTS